MVMQNVIQLFGGRRYSKLERYEHVVEGVTCSKSEVFNFFEGMAYSRVGGTASYRWRGNWQ